MDRLYEAEEGAFRLGLTGDTLLTRPLACFREPSFLGLQRLLAGCDAVFTNLESAVGDYLDLPHATRPTGGTYMTTPPSLLADLRWLGVDLVACGSSHADDYGQAGMLRTLAHLDAAGFARAGLGRHLAEARRPAFFDSPRGRVALLAATSQYNLGSRAGEQRPDAAGHPGVNALRRSLWYEVDEASLAALRRVGELIGWDAHRRRARAQGDALGEDRDAYDFLGTRFTVGPNPGVRTAVHPVDLEANLRQVAHARRLADYVVVSLHCHEQGGANLATAQRRSDVDDIADYAVEFGRACLDAGADVFVAHGPQVPLGIELHDGKPLFHGLGTFVFQLETLEVLPSEIYERYGLPLEATPSDVLARRYQDDTVGHPAHQAQWEQAVVVCEWADGRLRDIEIVPIVLGFGRARSQRGRPVLAGGETAQRILTRIAELSARHGTEVAISGDRGHITVAA